MKRKSPSIFHRFAVALPAIPIYVLLLVLATASAQSLTNNATLSRFHNFTYYEPAGAVFNPAACLSFDDGTAITISNKFQLRILSPTGVLTQQVLYWLVGLAENPYQLQFGDIYALPKGNIFLKYLVTDSKTNLTQTYGSIIQQDGTSLSKQIKLGDTFPLNQAYLVKSAVAFSNDQSDSFVFASSFNKTDIKWMKFDKVSNNGTFVVSSKDTISPSKPFILSAEFQLLSTVDGGWVIVWAARVAPNTLASDVAADPSTFVSPQGFVFASFLRNQRVTPDGIGGTSFVSNQFLAPVTLYQTQVPQTDLHVTSCGQNEDGNGYLCMVHGFYLSDPTQDIPFNDYWLRINFLTSGSVVAVGGLPFKLSDTTLQFHAQAVVPLFHTGFLAMGLDITGNVTLGFVVDDNGTQIDDWGLPKQLFSKDGWCVFKNNTVWTPLPGGRDPVTNSTLWNAVSADLRQLQKGFFYNTPNIRSTDPSINSTVSLGLTTVNITFHQPVYFSRGNISIYQALENTTSKAGSRGDILRQSYSGTSGQCQIVSENTASCKLLPSTVNNVSSLYYVVVDDGFVKSTSFDEPLAGIGAGVWKFSTNTSTITADSPEAVAILRLTSEGTRIFNDLSSEQQRQFYDDLVKQLTIALPVRPNRLRSTGYRSQYDDFPINPRRPQILLSVTVGETELSQERLSEAVVLDLNSLVTNMSVTPVGFGNVTRLLDASFGAQSLPNIAQDYEGLLIAIGVVVGIVGLISLAAYTRNREGNAFALIQLMLHLSNFTLKILFISIHGLNVTRLFAASIVFLCVPIIFNFAIANRIIRHEFTLNLAFHQWFRVHGRTTTFVSFVAAGSVDALRLLDSRFGAFKSFEAPFSEFADGWIFWFGAVGAIVFDLPWMIIQVLYQTWTVRYNIIPFLALMVSVLVLLNAILSRAATILIRWHQSAIVYHEPLEQLSQQKPGSGEGGQQARGIPQSYIPRAPPISSMLQIHPPPPLPGARFENGSGSPDRLLPTPPAYPHTGGMLSNNGGVNHTGADSWGSLEAPNPQFVHNGMAGHAGDGSGIEMRLSSSPPSQGFISQVGHPTQAFPRNDVAGATNVAQREMLRRSPSIGAGVGGGGVTYEAILD